jgi:penicillin-binding protein 2
MTIARGTSRRRLAARLTVSLATAALVAACSTAPNPTPYPTPAPTPSMAQAVDVARAYLAAWISGQYERMYALLAPADRARYPLASFVASHRQLKDLTRATALVANLGPARRIALPPEPRQPDEPSPSAAGSSAPSGTSAPSSSSGSPSPSLRASASQAPSAQASLSPGPVLPGPVPALAFETRLQFTTDLFGPVTLNRDLDLVAASRSWQVRWSPALLFPELGADGVLQLTRTTSARGRITAADGTIFALTRSDGMRVYPQETLAGQTIGYVSRVTAADLATLGAQGYRQGDWFGRSGLERGAEALLRGSPGLVLSAVRPGQAPQKVLEKPMVPGANVTITIRPPLQRAAEVAMRRYPRVASAAVDPRSGDVWVLASLPVFDPNAMTLGTTLRGVPLARPSSEQIINKAVLGAYPAGSDFKPFTLGAALQTRTVTTATRMLCPGTWPYGGFTFRNFMAHSMPGFHSWPETMAFSCNTTYMPLSIRVYGVSHTALTDTVANFGFGQPTGIRFLAENPGVLPDAAYFQRTPRYGTHYAPFNGFDQIQLAIGQGSYLGTPLQLTMAYAAWGNRGTLWEPRIVLKATLPDGTPVYTSQPVVHAKIHLDRAVMDYVVTTMRAVVTYSYGTAHRAFLGFPIAVAGKSGTAETGGPDPDAWFPAFAPMTSPTIAVATVVVTVPLGTGGDFAAPIVRQIMAAHFLR